MKQRNHVAREAWKFNKPKKFKNRKAYTRKKKYVKSLHDL